MKQRSAAQVTTIAALAAVTGHERDFINSQSPDVHTYIDYMHARYYNPAWGRFLSVDPIRNERLGTPQAWNRYAYVLNNPLLRVDRDGRKDTVYWLQSFNWREQRSVGNVVQAAVAMRNYDVQVTYFASRAEILSTLAKAERTDIVVVNSHASRAGMRESGIFGPKSLLSAKDMTAALAGDKSRPDAVILAGCATAPVAQAIASETGVPAIGTTSGVGLSVSIEATGVMIWSMLGGATVQEAVANGNQHLTLNPRQCEPYPCDGEFAAYSPADQNKKEQ